jgi:hypothetical protein
MKYRNVNFELGLDIWRWIIMPRSALEPTLIGQARGSRDQAIDHCKTEIDALLERESNAQK